MPDVATPATTAPPVDPVWAALADPEVGARLLALARSVLRRPEVDHEGLVQSAVERALANSHKFDPEAGSVTAWLTGFVRNVAREQLKRQSAAPKTDGELDRLPARQSDETGADDLRAALRRHLAALPELLRMAVELRHLEQLDYPAIAAAVGTTEATARQRVCRGLLLLRALATKEAS
ncbi:sigma-70 family RNA polymerase sigma factor [Gemmata sp. G18]|uniref:Sigma-70 family RNA polymerase sigma factor n=1 Tax=Gemmata palustris TaxID=2822762 RepID=A0ABS5BVU7_9BACT|nr:sigma-70 family RNA polymerase sigma factor [Gemmata palustris]MBP3957846.1 sigma-70 family RNA polymerase sigma factor [Gemmata palustris]